jgi:N-acetylmuramoyl-L-alanine amidase
MDIGTADIKRWHQARGWATTGYNFVIRRSGLIEAGRGIGEVGAHVRGFNSRSLGICMAGGVRDRVSMLPENNFTPEQFSALEILLHALLHIYPEAKVCGHRDLAATDCPSFDVVEWAKDKGFPV